MHNNYPWLDETLRSLPGAQWDYKIEWGWERYRVGDRMFAATCRPGDKFGEYGGHPLLSIKCDPVRAQALRERYAHIRPGFYMDKVHWISIFLDGDVPAELVRELALASYAMIFCKLPKRTQAYITQGAGGAPGV